MYNVPTSGCGTHSDLLVSLEQKDKEGEKEKRGKEKMIYLS